MCARLRHAGVAFFQGNRVNGPDLLARLTHPAVQALLLGLGSTALVLWRRPRLALVAACVAIAWIGIASTPTLAMWLRAGLVVPPSTSATTVDAIVVLGGGRLPVGPWTRGTTRVEHGLSLWRRHRARLLLVAGADQAHALARGLAAHGVPDTALRMDDRSGNTHENAVNSAAILQAERAVDIVLVTSAIHARRAQAAFRHEGFTVIASPVADEDAVVTTANTWLPRRDALTLTARCLREYVALWVYRWRGWI